MWYCDRMPSFVVRKVPGTSLDGSSYGPSMTIVHASSESLARVEGAKDLRCRPSEVIVEKYQDPFWGDAA